MKDRSSGGLHFQDISAHRQFLYGVSALWILFFHMNTDLPARGGLRILRLIQATGNCGVEIFLLLTGYGLYGALNRNPNVPRFYRRRLARVLVPALITFLCCDLFACPLLYGYAITPRFLLAWPWSGGLWYVSFILLMYLIYPLLHRWNRRENRRQWWIALVCISIFVFSMDFWPVAMPKEILRPATRIPVFLLGCMLALPAQENRRIPRWTLGALAAATCIAYALRKIINRAGQVYGPRMPVYLLLAATLILLLTYIARMLQGCALGRGIYGAIFFCGGISLEIYLAYDRVRELMEFLPVAQGVSSMALDWIAAAIALGVAYLLRRLCARITRGLNQN